MKSKIKMSEVVNNKDRKFGSILEYYPCKIEQEDGTISNALFTANQIQEAIDRGNLNPEDITEDNKGLFSIFW